MTEGTSTIIGSLISGAFVAVGWALNSRRSSKRAATERARQDERQEARDKQCMDLHAEHRERLTKHDEKFERMPLDYVPRTEVQATLSAIRDSADRQERWLEFLVKKEATEPKA